MVHDLTKKCLNLVRQYVNDQITLEQFRSSYFDLYLNSTDLPDELSFDILDSLYAVLDLYTDDPDLLKDSSGLYLDEDRVKEEAKQVLEKLNKIRE